ncbi:MAG TPA: AgmX/PglI C-terminal domain-containing protein [Anaeromyxobacteraceae bacterium]|jgi:hypothetical protein
MRAPKSRETHAAREAPAAPEWTFLKDGQAFGPVSGERLRELVRDGEVGADTLVAPDGAEYRPLGGITDFLVDLRKAEARQRVEREVTASRRLARRRRLLGWAAAGVLVAGGAAGAGWLAVFRPWERRSALLDDFGNGVTVSIPARVGAGRPRAVEAAEVAVPRAGEASARVPRRRELERAAPAPASAPAGGDGLVEARWDRGDIEAVVGREQRTLAPCLRREAGRSPDFAGEIPIEFAVGNEGRVEALWIEESRFRTGPLRDCLLQALQRWRFKPFPGQRPVVALSFRIGAP